MPSDDIVDLEVERRRLKFSLSNLMVSPENAEVGLGDLKDDRLALAIAIVVEGYELPRAPQPSEVFDRSFEGGARDEIRLQLAEAGSDLV